MNAVVQLIAELGRLGVQPAVVGDRLKLRGPANRITPELIEHVRPYKAELLTYLREEAERADIARVIALDRERHERDRAAKRGYDYDPTAPGHAEYLAQGSPVTPEAPYRPITPAESLVDTCKRYGVGLSAANDGTLVIDYAQAWPTLLQALTAHSNAIANLLIVTSNGARIALRRADA